MAVSWWMLVLLVAHAESRDPPPHNPCPDVYSYEWEFEEGWHGVITIIPPPRFSEIRVRVRTSLQFYRPNAGKGRIELSGGVQEEEKIQVKARRGETQQVKFLVFYPPYNKVPRIAEVNINGKEFCRNVPEYKDTVANITLDYTLRSGLETPLSTGDEFSTVNDAGQRFGSSLPSTTGTPSTLPTTAKCGRKTTVLPLITGGQETEPGDWPWHVAMYEKKSLRSQYICGATLIAPATVVTAAHCVAVKGNHGRRFVVVPIAKREFKFGKYFYDPLKDNAAEVQTRMAKEFVVHPEYLHTDVLINDIAMVILVSPVTYTELVLPACLWQSSQDDSGKIGTVVGWGVDENDQSNNVLTYALTPIVSNEDCLLSDTNFFSKILFRTTRSFCAGYKNGTSACNGDSGGGLYLKREESEESVTFIKGIVSFAKGKSSRCDPYDYTVYTDVGKYLPFIGQHMK